MKCLTVLDCSTHRITKDGGGDSSDLSGKRWSNVNYRLGLNDERRTAVLFCVTKEWKIERKIPPAALNIP